MAVMMSRVTSVPLTAWAYGATAFAALTAVTRAFTDPFAAAKVLVIWVAAAVCLVGLVATAHFSGVPRGLPRRALLAAWALPGAFTLGLLATDDVVGSLIGTAERYGGLLTYTALAILFTGIVWAGQTRPDVPRAVIVGLSLSALATAGYGIVQALDLDPWNWSTSASNKAIGTQGNTNYTAALSAVGVGASLAAALRGSPAVRTFGGIGLALGLFGALATGTSQGVLLLPVAVLVPFLGWLFQRPGAMGRHGGQVVLAGVVVAGALVVGGVLGVGPGRSLADDPNSQDRADTWTASARMLQDHPVLGVGPSRFARNVREYRTAESAQGGSALRAASDPHSVPIAMTLGAGIFGLLAHLAFVVTVGRRLVAGLRERGTQDGWLLAAGAMWLTYQAQSVISLDVPALSALHWLSAAVIVTTTQHAWTPGGTASLTAGAGPRTPLARPRVVAAGGAALALVLLFGWAVWLVGPAQTTARYGLALLDADRNRAAANVFKVEAPRAMWQSEMPTYAGRAYFGVQDYQRAEYWLRDAADRQEGVLAPLLLLFEAHFQQEDYDAAHEVANEAIALDGQVGETWFLLARAEAARGNLDEAIAAANEALLRDPSMEKAQSLIEQVQQAQGGA